MTETFSQTSVGVGIVPILPIHRELANIAAMCRRTANDGRRRPESDLGQEKNDRADLVGLLGEFVAISLLERHGLRPYYTLVSDRPVREADLKLGNVRIEVKATSHGRFIFVNSEQHQRRQADFYLAVILGEADAEVLAPIPWEVVEGWVTRHDRHSPYKSVEVATLPRLASIEQITSLLPTERPLATSEARQVVAQDSRAAVGRMTWAQFRVSGA